MSHVDREKPCGYCVFWAFSVLVALLCAFSRTNTGLHGRPAGPDERIYLGTWDGGLILRFDPKQPDKGIQVVGQPAASESFNNLSSQNVGRQLR
jgi:hypothetical protein